METNTIKTLLRKYECFKGVYPSDKLPYDAQLPLTIICNTDPAHLPGTHWVCISIDERRIGYYFDSFGSPPLIENIFKFLEHMCIQWYYNTYTLQHISSSTCGYYCVLFVLYNCSGLSMYSFFQNFGNNPLANDHWIKSQLENELVAVQHSN